MSLNAPLALVSSLTAAPDQRSASLRFTAGQHAVNQSEPAPPPLSTRPFSLTLAVVPKVEFSPPLQVISHFLQVRRLCQVKGRLRPRVTLPAVNHRPRSPPNCSENNGFMSPVSSLCGRPRSGDAHHRMPLKDEPEMSELPASLPKGAPADGEVGRVFRRRGVRS